MGYLNSIEHRKDCFLKGCREVAEIENTTIKLEILEELFLKCEESIVDYLEGEKL